MIKNKHKNKTKIYTYNKEKKTAKSRVEPGVMDHQRGRPAPRPLFHAAKDNRLIGEIIIFKVLFA